MQNTNFITHYKSLNLFEREKLAKSGITKSQLLELREAMGLSLQQISELMAITDRTLYLKRDSDRLSRIVTDRVLALLEIYHGALQIFKERFLLIDWLNRPNAEIAHQTPLRLLETYPGQQRVRELLTNLFMDNYEAAQRPNPIRFNSAASATDS